MNAVHTRRHAPRASQARTPQPFSWNAHIKLAIVLSAIAAIVAATLAERIGEPSVIVGTIVVASLLGWSRVQIAPQTAPAHVHQR